MAESLRPQWFVTRQNGSMVPLVAMDELPSTVSIQDVPRRLSPHDIKGMTGLGTHNTRHKQYAVNGNQRSFPLEKGLMQSAFATTSQPFSQVADSTPTPPTTPGPTSSSPQSPVVKTISESTRPSSCASPGPEAYNQERIAQLKGEGSSYRRLDTIPATPRRVKEYCSYWLRHGECDYAQQGCLYKHEMPLEPEVLARLGLRDIPRWYREKHGLVSYLGGNTSIGIEESKRPDILNTNWRALPPYPSGRDDLTRHTQGLSISTYASPQPRRLPPVAPSQVAFRAPGPTGLHNSKYASPFPTPPRGPPTEPLAVRRARAANFEKHSFDAPLPQGALTNFPPLIPGLEESIGSRPCSSEASSAMRIAQPIATTPAPSPATTSKKTRATTTTTTNAVIAVGTTAATVPAKQVTAETASTTKASESTAAPATVKKGKHKRGGHGHARRRAAARAKAKANDAKDKSTTSSQMANTKSPVSVAVKNNGKEVAADGESEPKTSQTAVVGPEAKEEKACVPEVCEKAKKD